MFSSWFQCPSGHFLIQTSVPSLRAATSSNSFQCPSGHFLIQTYRRCGMNDNMVVFQCPSGHFLIQTDWYIDMDSIEAEFQCPSGHFLIQTPQARGSPGLHLRVSMPVRAFLDSDQLHPQTLRSFSRTVSMPVRAFLDSDPTKTLALIIVGSSVSMPVRAFLDSDSFTSRWINLEKRFNARQGIS